MGSSYPTTTPPGRFGRPRCNSMGHASSPLYEQAGQVGSRHMLIPARWRGPMRAGTTVHMRFPTPGHRHMLAWSKQHSERPSPQPLVLPTALTRAARARPTQPVSAFLRVRPTRCA